MRLDEKIQELQKDSKRKITYEEVAEVLGLGSKQAAYNRVTRKTPLKDWEIIKLDEKFKDSEKENEDCITIEHIHINPSCGSGTIVIDEPNITPIKLGKKLLESVLRVTDISNLKTFTASGDSMEDTIDDGNLLLVDLGRTDFNNGGVFVISKNNDWFVKRLRLKVNGELEIISDNHKYATEIFKPDDNVEIKVQGRVIKNLSKGL